MLASLRRLVPADYVTYNEIDRQRRRVVYLGDPADWPAPPGALQAFQAHLHEHPMLTQYWRTRETAPLKFSDFLTRRQLHDLGLWQEFFLPMGLEHQLTCVLSRAARYRIGLAFNRAPGAPDFSERDRLVLALLQPHLVQAYESAAAITRMLGDRGMLEAALETQEASIVVVGPDGRIGPLSASARRRLEEYFDRPRRRDRLPEELARWAREAGAASRATDDLPRPVLPLITERIGRRLVVRRLDAGDRVVLVLEEQRTAPDVDALRRFGLTPRETEVLTWAVEGKSNPEIATILGMRRRTVAKHLERTYAKLGVEGRGPAMRLLLTPP
jgi:DNA-binding CsgD family transcriptional regulator